MELKSKRAYPHVNVNFSKWNYWGKITNSINGIEIIGCHLRKKIPPDTICKNIFQINKISKYEK